jgi:DNA-binding transcriptional regulator YiaG
MPVPAAERIPNRALRALRLALRLSQSEFAAAIRHAGEALGEPNTCNKRLVQKWESGEHVVCRPNYRRALQSVTRTPYEQLGFAGVPSAPRAVAVVPHARAAEAFQPVDTVVAAEPGDRLRYALERPEQADTETVAMVETAVAHHFDLERHRPARLLAPAVSRHTAEIAALLAGTGEIRCAADWPPPGGSVLHWRAGSRSTAGKPRRPTGTGTVLWRLRSTRPTGLCSPAL